MLFCFRSGLTLVFGINDMINSRTARLHAGRLPRRDSARRPDRLPAGCSSRSRPPRSPRTAVSIFGAAQRSTPRPPVQVLATFALSYPKRSGRIIWGRTCALRACGAPGPCSCPGHGLPRYRLLITGSAPRWRGPVPARRAHAHRNAGARRRVQPRNGARDGGQHRPLFTLLFGVGPACAPSPARCSGRFRSAGRHGEKILILPSCHRHRRDRLDPRRPWVRCSLGSWTRSGARFCPALRIFFQPRVASAPGRRSLRCSSTC